MIIDATNTILGRLATLAAKQALLGEKVDIVNAEKAIVSGKKSEVLARWRHKYTGRGTPSTGPFILRQPDRFVRRVIRGMLPYKIPRGREAYANIKCYKGVPESFEGKEFTKVDATKDKLPNNKFVTVDEISRNLGGTQ